MSWVLNEFKMIYQIDILRLRSKLFLFLFNLVPDFYFMRIFKNILLWCSGIKINIIFTYIKNGLYGDDLNNISIKKGTFINRNVAFEGEGKVWIGSSVQIGPNAQFVTTSHKDHREDNIENITIGNNVWIGANVVILPGTHIGDNINIAAGSIVKGNVCTGELWAGVPAIQKR